MGTFFKRWGRDQSGTTAVEFSMVGIPFILMTVGIVEMALMFTSQSNLQEAAFTASRMIRTGQLQQSGGNQEEIFKEAVCDFAILVPCDQIKMQVKKLPSFADVKDDPPKYDADGNFLDEGFDPGGANEIVLIRLVYNYPVRTPMMQPMLSNVGNSKFRMVSTVVLQSEPYEED